MLKDILQGLVALLGPIATMSRERRELKDSVLRAISTALEETSLYYRDSRRMPRNFEREAMISRYWSAAAIPLRNFDEHLSMICDRKGEYWIDPDRYSEAEITDLGIELDAVRQAYRKMLRPDIGVQTTRFS